MRYFRLVESMYDLRPGDIVKVSNGYEVIEVELSAFDIEMRSVSNGLHNERARLDSASFGVFPTFHRPQGDLF